MAKYTEGKLEYTSGRNKGWWVKLWLNQIRIAHLEGVCQDEAEAIATEFVRRWNAFEEGGSHKALVSACEEIAGLETECCSRCEGGGRIWADGKPHFPHEQAGTIPCGSCGGSGRILPDDAQEIAEAALARNKEKT